MTPAQRELIDHQHAQKHLNSSPASLCEMLLKLAGAIPVDCSEYQDADPDGKGGVGKLVGKKLPQGYAFKKIPQQHPWEFPAAAIKAKLAANIPVGVYLNPDHQRAHGWLV